MAGKPIQNYKLGMNQDAKIALIVTGSIIAVGALTFSTSAGRNLLLLPEQELFIQELHPQLQHLARKFVQRVRRETGYSVVFTSGYRSFERQHSIKYNTNDPNYDAKAATPGLSLHNYGLAFDINLIRAGEHIRKKSPAAVWKKTGIVKIADEMGLRWGGRFNDYYDPVHFDLGKRYNTSVLLNMAHNQFGKDLVKIRGNKIKL